MIISDRHRFAFVHIPKCGGTSVRTALQALDERSARYFGRGRSVHPELGPLDFHHVPLAVLRDHFADDFACLRDYAAFALCRDPFERFPSSVFQKIRGGDPARVSADEMRREVDAVIRRLSDLPRGAPVVEPDLIHFSRQSDYVELDGERIVGNVFRVSEIDEMLARIAELTGCQGPSAGRENARMRYINPVLQAVDRRLQPLVMGVLPRSVWKPAFTVLKHGLVRAGLLARWDDWHREIFASEDVRAFIASFYADDVRLYADCAKARGDRRA
jgi:hypothetical protein